MLASLTIQVVNACVTALIQVVNGRLLGIQAVNAWLFGTAIQGVNACTLGTSSAGTSAAPGDVAGLQRTPAGEVQVPAQASTAGALQVRLPGDEAVLHEP